MARLVRDGRGDLFVDFEDGSPLVNFVRNPENSLSDGLKLLEGKLSGVSGGRINTLQQSVKHLSEENKRLRTVTDEDVERVAEALAKHYLAASMDSHRNAALDALSAYLEPTTKGDK